MLPVLRAADACPSPGPGPGRGWDGAGLGAVRVMLVTAGGQQRGASGQRGGVWRTNSKLPAGEMLQVPWGPVLSERAPEVCGHGDGLCRCAGALWLMHTEETWPTQSPLIASIVTIFNWPWNFILIENT